MESSTAAKDAQPTEPQVTESPHGTLSGQPLREASGGDDGVLEERTEAEAVQEAARQPVPKRIPADVQSAATQWFLNARPDTEDVTKTLKLNMGSEDKPEHIDWVIKAVEIDTMRSIRRRAANTREARRTGNTDEFMVNLNIVIAGTLDPPITKLTAELAQAGEASNDPAAVLRDRFRRKPGMIAQIAGQILGISGFDSDDVQEDVALEAAKN